MGEVVDLEAARLERQPGWRVARRAMCLDCGREWVGVLPPETKPVKLECPDCHEAAGIVMEWDDGGV